MSDRAVILDLVDPFAAEEVIKSSTLLEISECLLNLLKNFQERIFVFFEDVYEKNKEVLRNHFIENFAESLKNPELILTWKKIQEMIADNIRRLHRALQELSPQPEHRIDGLLREIAELSFTALQTL